jgi:hypothetical protein
MTVMCLVNYLYQFPENRVLRRIVGPKKDEVTANGENYIMRS